jgi:hypothetical protein
VQSKTNILNNTSISTNKTNNTSMDTTAAADEGLLVSFGQFVD